MKTTIKSISLILIVFIFAINTASIAQVEIKTTKTEKSEKSVIWNAYCPVSGDEVDRGTKTVEYKGKNIGFCCKSCIKKFNKNPEKYMKNLSEDGKKFIGKASSMH